MVHVTPPFENVTATPNGIRVKFPYGKISQATHSDILNLPFLPIEARRVHLFGTLEEGSLLSLENIFDSGCTAYLNAKKV